MHKTANKLRASHLAHHLTAHLIAHLIASESFYRSFSTTYQTLARQSGCRSSTSRSGRHRRRCIPFISLSARFGRICIQGTRNWAVQR